MNSPQARQRHGVSVERRKPGRKCPVLANRARPESLTWVEDFWWHKVAVRLPVLPGSGVGCSPLVANEDCSGGGAVIQRVASFVKSARLWRK